LFGLLLLEAKGMRIIDSLLVERDRRISADAIWIANRSDGFADPILPSDPVQGTGRKDDPFDGSNSVKFDHNLARIATVGMYIRLGPGLFRTFGGDANSHIGSWQPKSRQRITGAGIFQTTLQLIVRDNPGWENEGYSVIGANQDQPIDGFEISDLTLDANVHRQPLRTDADATRPNIVCAGLQFLNAKNTRIRRVRFINFGTQTPEKVLNTPNPYTHECFALTLGGANHAENRRLCGPFRAREIDGLPSTRGSTPGFNIAPLQGSGSHHRRSGSRLSGLGRALSQYPPHPLRIWVNAPSALPPISACHPVPDG